MTYDVDNRLDTYTQTENNKTTTQSNLYNGDGQRIQKSEGDNTINYYYQNGNVLYTTDKDEKKTSHNFVGLEGNIISTMRYDLTGLEYYVYNKDIKGSTTNIVDNNKNAKISYKYSDFGETREIGDTDFYNEIAYTGGIYDESTELYYLNARYYNPEDARFITQDTYRGEVNNPSSLHLYVYCINNPINYVDPSGHVPKAPGAWKTQGPDSANLNVTKRKNAKKWTIKMWNPLGGKRSPLKIYYKTNWYSGNTKIYYDYVQKARVEWGNAIGNLLKDARLTLTTIVASGVQGGITALKNFATKEAIKKGILAGCSGAIELELMIRVPLIVKYALYLDKTFQAYIKI